MLCSKFKQLISTKSSLNANVHYRYMITSRYMLKRWVDFDEFLSFLAKKEGYKNMSSLRILLKDIRFWRAWTRSTIVNTVVKKCRTDRSVREVIQCFRQAFSRPRRTLFLSATAACKAKEDDEEDPPSCSKNITDEEMQMLLKQVDGVESLTRDTLFCPNCGLRLVIEKKQPGIRYCGCKDPAPAVQSSDGWMPYMEAEDVIIWRKEYKPGRGLYAYKVYGRYSEVRASDFAAIQVDGRYRMQWDAAVASLSVVEPDANGVPDQAVLHWEVLWPRLFANRDYVYLRRHKEFEVTSKAQPLKDALFHSRSGDNQIKSDPERPSVHSNAKRKSMEAYEKQNVGHAKDKVFVIVSRSCQHSSAPETKHAIRVTEYWSHMVVKTLEGPDKNGMEFVLTYYDVPAVGGMPSGVAAWATGRAAPTYLTRMREAANHYRTWRREQPEELLEPVPFVTLPQTTPKKEEPASSEEPATSEEPVAIKPVKEEDMKTCEDGPDLDCGPTHRDQSTQTENPAPEHPEKQPSSESGANTEPQCDKDIVDVVYASEPETKTTEEKPPKDTAPKEIDAEKTPKGTEDKEKTAEDAAEEDESPTNSSWWKYLYPFYYFV